jgi:hypothetical protein
MATVAQPFTEMFLLASAGLAEGQSVLAEAPDVRGEAGRPLLAYAYQAFVSGLIQLEALTRRYVASPECAGATSAKPILSDPAFRAAAIECANGLDGAAPALGVVAGRMSTVLRRWIETSNPADARLLAAQCDTAARMTKMKAGRAA